MSRVICSYCGKDLGPSPTPEDSHGICDTCGAALLRVTVEEFMERVERDKMEREETR